MTILRIVLTCIVGLFIVGCVCFSTPAYPDKNPELKKFIEGTKVIEDVRYKGKIWCWISPNLHVMICRTLYLDKIKWDTYNDFTKRSIIVHEVVHAARQSNAGFATWLAFYACSSKFRWEEEKVAYTEEWKWWLRNNFTFQNYEYNNFAKSVSQDYWGMTTFDEAKKFMTVTIASLQKSLEAEKNPK